MRHRPGLPRLSNVNRRESGNLGRAIRVVPAGEGNVSRPATRRHSPADERTEMNVHSVNGLMRAMELEGSARIDIIRIGKDIQNAGHARRSPTVQQYEELRRAVVTWQRIAADIGRIVSSG